MIDGCSGLIFLLLGADECCFVLIVLTYDYQTIQSIIVKKELTIGQPITDGPKTALCQFIFIDASFLTASTNHPT